MHRAWPQGARETTERIELRIDVIDERELNRVTPLQNSQRLKEIVNAFELRELADVQELPPIARSRGRGGEAKQLGVDPIRDHPLASPNGSVAALPGCLPL